MTFAPKQCGIHAKKLLQGIQYCFISRGRIAVSVLCPRLIGSYMWFWKRVVERALPNYTVLIQRSARINLQLFFLLFKTRKCSSPLRTKFKYWTRLSNEYKWRQDWKNSVKQYCWINMVNFCVLFICSEVVLSTISGRWFAVLQK